MTLPTEPAVSVPLVFDISNKLSTPLMHMTLSHPETTGRTVSLEFEGGKARRWRIVTTPTELKDFVDEVTKEWLQPEAIWSLYAPTKAVIDLQLSRDLGEVVQKLKQWGAGVKLRPNWDSYFLNLAKMVASRASCDRAAVGAVIVKDQHPIATGYNGAPPGQPSCDEVGHELVQFGDRKTCVRSSHAEVNALLSAARFGGGVTGSTMYCTHLPCIVCARSILAAGVTSVVLPQVWGQDIDFAGLHLLRDAGLEPRRIPSRLETWSDLLEMV